MTYTNKITAILKRENHIALAIYVALSILILRDILLTEYQFGFNHDWIFPYTAYELKIYVTQAFYLWYDSNLGTHTVYPAKYLLQYILLPCFYLGFTGASSIKILLFLIFVFSGYFMYRLVYETFKLSYIPSLISGIFYIITPVIYNKVIAGHLLFLIGYTLSPLIIIYLTKYINTNRIKYLILVGLLIAFASIQIQFSVMLFILVTFYSFLVANANMHKIIKIILFITLIPLLIHSFWILPSAINFSSVTEIVVAASNTDNLNSWSTSLINAFGLIGYRSHHFSTALDNHNYKDIWNFLSASLLILVFSSLFAARGRIPFFFGIVSIVTLIFTTAASPPFGNLVTFLYSNYPIFNLFREVYHLTFLLGFSYSVMLGYTFHKIYNYKNIMGYKLISVLFIIIIIVAYNPFMYTGNFNGQIQTYEFDGHDISLMNSYQKSDGSYRVLYLPMVSPFKYNNSKYNGLDPIIAYSKKPSMGNNINSQFIRYMALNLHDDTYGNLYNLLDLSSVKYIFYRNNYKSILPHYLKDGQYAVYDDLYDIRPIWQNENLYKTLIDSEELIIVEKSKNIVVFENKNYLPFVYAVPNLKYVDSISDFYQNLESNTSQIWQQNIIVSSQNQNKTIPQVHTSIRPYIYFQKINPTKYKIKIENAKEPFYLTLSESFNLGWQAYINTDTIRCDPIDIYKNANVTECKPEFKLFEVTDITKIFSDTIPEDNHFIANGYSNAWYIDPQQLDTGENFTVTLYFKPQSYFYIGLIISGLTFIVCVGYLFWDWRKRTTTKSQPKVIL